MAKSIKEVKGIGPASALLLKEAGIGTVSELANATVECVASIKGFSGIRAARVIEDAKALIALESRPAAAVAAPPAKTKSTKPSSGKKNKTDKKKSDTKKKDKKGDKKKNDGKKATKKDSKKKKGNKKGKKKH